MASKSSLSRECVTRLRRWLGQALRQLTPKSETAAAIHYALVNIAEMGHNIVSVPQLYGATYTLLAHILPKLGARPITEIDAPELVAMAKILRTAEPVTWPSGPCRPTKFSRGEDGQRDDGDRKFSVSNANDSHDPLPPLPRSSPSDEVPRSPSQAL